MTFEDILSFNREKGDPAMKGKRVWQFFLVVFALNMLICNAYIAGYTRGQGYEQVSIPASYLGLSLNILMGLAILLFGATIKKDGAYKQARRIATFIGGFLAVGSVIGILLVAFLME